MLSKGSAAGDDSVNTVLLLDRLVSASTAADVIESLQHIERGLKQQQQQQGAGDSGDLAASILEQEDDVVLNAFWKLLYREHAVVRRQVDEDSANDGVLWTCRILLQLLLSSSSSMAADHAKTLLQKPAPGRILEGLMDVVVADHGESNEEGAAAVPASSSSSLSSYVRVLACQALHRLCQLQPSLAQPQLLAAPNGLHRLGDLLQLNTDETVRNEALLLAATLAQWPAVAQVWIFSNLAEGLLELAVAHDEGGLSQGPVLVQDCVSILKHLVTHANPQMAAELLLSGGGGNNDSFGRHMMFLLDLRQGYQFQHPESIVDPATSASSSTATAASKTQKAKQQQEDDLDDLIKSASKPKPAASSAATSGEISVTEPDPPAPVPRLLASEETILRTLLDIWLTLLQDNVQVQQMAARQHSAVLRMIWEMALLSPPPTPSTPYPCAVPSASLQQYALHVVAQALVPTTTTTTTTTASQAPATNNNNIGVSEMDRDRLLYLTCTGGLGSTRREKFQISQAALFVLRRAAPTVFTTEMIAFALAPPPPPPPPEDDDGEQQQQSMMMPPPEAVVVPKLLSTVQQHLSPPMTTMTTNPNATTEQQPLQQQEADMHVVGLVGSTTALSLFLRDDVSRTMLLKLVQKQVLLADDPSFVDQLLQRIEHETNATETTPDNSSGGSQSDANSGGVQVAACLLRFLAQWCFEAPEVVYAVLSSPHATLLAILYNNSSSRKSSVVSTMAHKAVVMNLAQLAGLVLGTCLAQLHDETLAAGWTRETLMSLLSRRQQTVLQVQPKQQQTQASSSSAMTDDSDLPWSFSSFESNVFWEWRSSTLLLVRQAMVQYLTTLTAAGGDDDDDEGEAAKEGDAEGPDESSSHSLQDDGAAVTATVAAAAATGSANKNSKALTQIVAQQTTELEALRQELATAQAQILEKDKELSVFRLRVESTPTELDSLVRETTQQNAQLQEQMAELQKKDEETKQALAAVEEKLTIAQREKDESRQEAETLRQDMESLTQAYSNLEGEFELQKEALEQANAKNSSEAAAEAEGKSEELASASTQVATLRAENTRLREDAKAADSWMKMAVERFQSLEQEKAGLQQQLSTLEQGAPQQAQIDALLSQQRAQLQKEHEEQVENLQEQLQHEITESETEIARLTDEWESARSSHEEERDRLQTRIEDLKNQFDSVRYSHEEERDELQTRIEDLRQQVNMANPTDSAPTSSASTNPPAASNANENDAEVQELRDQLAALQTQLQEADRVRNEQAYQHESTIRELQARLDSDLGSYTVEDIRTRDEEIVQLRESNDAAQDWMAKAVEHHQMLSEQLTALTSENTTLKTENKDLNAKLLPFQASALLSEQLQTDLEEQTAQVEKLSIELSDKEREMEEVMESNTATMDALRAQLTQATTLVSDKEKELQEIMESNTATMNALRAQLTEATDGVVDKEREEGELLAQLAQATAQVSDKEREMQELAAQSANAAATVETLRAQLVQATAQVSDKEREMQELIQSNAATVEALRAQLVQATAQVELLQSQPPAPGAAAAAPDPGTQVIDLQAKLVQQTEQIQELSNKEHKLQEKFTEVNTRACELEMEVAELKAELSDAEEDKETLLGKNKDLEQRVKFLDVSNQDLLDRELRDKEEQFADELEQAVNAKDGEIRQITQQWESRCTRLEEEVRVLEERRREAEARLGDMAVEQHESTQTAGERRSENEADTVQELESQIAHLREEMDSQEREASGVIAQWQESYSAMEARCTELQTRLVEMETAVSSSTNNNAVLAVPQAGSEDLQQRITELQQQLQENEQQASTVIAQWQESHSYLQKENADLLARIEGAGAAAPAEAQSSAKTDDSPGVSSDGQAASEIASLKETVAELERRLKEASAQAEKGQKGLETQKQALEAQLATMSQEYDDMIGQDEQLQQKLRTLERKVTELESSLGTSRTLADDQANRIIELEKELESKVAQLEGEENEADQIIQEWQDSYNDVVKEKTEVERKLESLTTEHQAAIVERDQRASLVNQLEARVQVLEVEKAGLESNVARLPILEAKLKEKENEIERFAGESETVRSWQERNRVLEDELESLRSRMDSVANALEEARSRKEADKVKIVELESALKDSEQDKVKLEEAADRISELEAELRTTEEQFASDSQEADEVIEQWKESYESLEAAKNELETRVASLEAEKTEIVSSRDEFMAMADQLQSDLLNAQNSSNLAEMTKLQGEVDALQNQVESLSAEKELAVSEKETLVQRIGDLEQTVKELESKQTTAANRIVELEEDVRIKEDALEKDAADAEDVINQWQESYDQIATEKSEIEERLEAVQTKLAESLEEKASLQSKVEEAEQKSIERVAELQAEHKDRILSLEKQAEVHCAERDAAQSRVEALEKDLQQIESSPATQSRVEELEKEINSTQTKLLQLEESRQAVVVEKEAANSRIKELEQELDSVTMRMNDLEESRRTEVDVLRVEKEAASSRIEVLEKEVASTKNQLQDLEESKRTEIDAARGEIEKLEKDAVLLQKREEDALSKHKSDKESHVERTLALESELRQAQEQLAASLKNSKDLEAQKAQLRSQLDAATQDLDHDRSAFDKLKAELGEERTHSAEGFDRVKDLQQSLDEANSRLQESEKREEELQAKCLSLEALSSSLATGIDAARMEFGSKESDQNNQIEQLNRRVVELEEALAAEVEQADEAIQQWQESYDALAFERDELESRLLKNDNTDRTEDTARVQALSSQLEETNTLLQTRDVEHQQLLSSFEATLQLFDEQKAAHAATLDQLRLDLGQPQEQSVTNDVVLLQSQYDALQASKQALEKQLGAVVEELKTSQGKLENAHLEISQRDNLLGDIRKKQMEFEGENKRLADRVLQLQAEVRLSGGSEELNDIPGETTDYRAELAAEREARKKELDQRMKLELEIESQKAESDRLIRSWKGEAEEFGKLLQDTRVEQDLQRRESDATISKLQARLAKQELEVDTRALSLVDGVPRSKYEDEVAIRKKAEAEVTLLKKNLQEMREETVALKQKSSKTEAMLTSRLETVLSEQEQITAEKEAQRALEHERYAALERELDFLRSRLVAVEQERDGLRASVADLEGHLKEATDELQLHLTNEISEQATKLAADALRRQVDEMRQQAEVGLSEYNAERTARLAAEQEAKRLQRDIAAMLGMEYNETNQNEIRRRTAEATENFQRMEQVEIEELKDSLARAVEELESARGMLKDAEERADAAELRSVKLEQDFVSAKSDLTLLSQMMDDMRESEAARRTPMEHRISALEEEQNVSRRFHEAEVENMRNELEQVSLERDNLLQSLQESEKSKDALLHASSRGRGLENEQNAGVELVQLRMEKAHLLAAASQEASRTERKLRELREAAKSSTEADVLVERELRAAAELALGSATAELRETRSRLAAASSVQNASDAQNVAAELDRLKNRISSLEHEKLNLQQQLDKSKDTAQETINQLKEEVRSAKAKALHSERAVRHDAEVRAEVARLHDAPSQEHQGLRNPSSHGEYKYSDDAQISSLYDLIEQQRQTIEEQREAHASMEIDFEGLLALLAQSKLVEESLSSALVQARGEKAVREAITRAEERAVAQYGTFVRVSE